MILSVLCANIHYGDLQFIHPEYSEFLFHSSLLPRMLELPTKWTAARSVCLWTARPNDKHYLYCDHSYSLTGLKVPSKVKMRNKKKCYHHHRVSVPTTIIWLDG